MSANMENQFEEIKSVLSATAEAIDKMNDGDRVQINSLVETVAGAVSKDVKFVTPFVHHMIHNTNIAYVSRGKNGGVVKGTKPAKIVKAGKKTKKSDSDNS